MYHRFGFRPASRSSTTVERSIREVDGTASSIKSIDVCCRLQSPDLLIDQERGQTRPDGKRGTLEGDQIRFAILARNGHVAIRTDRIKSAIGVVTVRERAQILTRGGHR
jgi:hypothetical protein